MPRARLISTQSPAGFTLKPQEANSGLPSVFISLVLADFSLTFGDCLREVVNAPLAYS